MAAKIHYIQVTAFAKPQDAAKLNETLKRILPEESKIEEIHHEPETEGGVFREEIIEYSAKIEGTKNISSLHEKVVSGMDDFDKKRFFENTSSYIDDECNLYLRLSKNEAMQGCMVMESKDCIHMRYKLACYPAKKENAIAAAKSILENGIH